MIQKTNTISAPAIKTGKKQKGAPNDLDFFGNSELFHCIKTRKIELSMMALKTDFSKTLLVMASLWILSLLSADARVLEAGSIDEVKCDSEECGEILMLEDFTSPKHKWVEMNDPGMYRFFVREERKKDASSHVPSFSHHRSIFVFHHKVMGGKSTGTFHVDDKNNVGVFHGSVEIVSFLNAPGFIKAETTKGESWPDASSCAGLQFSLKSSVPSYQGFRVSFGSKKPKGSFPYTYGFKTDLKLATTTDFQIIRLPFEKFTDKWDAGTGNAVVTCAENEEYCPGIEDKADLYSIAVWGEGFAGEVDLQIRSIAAYGCHNGDAEEEESNTNVAESTSSSSSDTIAIEDFSQPAHKWTSLNDPVMGGQSKSSVLIGDGMAHFEGVCAIVPFLQAPGFITMVTGGYLAPKEHFPDVSNCQGLSVSLRSTVEYEGYYISFGKDRVPGGGHAMGYKTHLDVAKSDAFSQVKLPFSNFSSNWDEATGKTKVTCQEDPQYCPSLDNLRDMKTISFWGEGVEGVITLDVRSIDAYGCASSELVDSSLEFWEEQGCFGWIQVGAVVVACLFIVYKIQTRIKHSRNYQEIAMTEASLA